MTTREPADRDCITAAGHCITCGDEGIAMRVVHRGEDLATCADARGALHEVAVELVAPVAPGDELLVHAGVALRSLGDGA